jgi:signal transduction histidine kinase
VNATTRSLLRPIVIVAFATAFVLWAVLTTWAAIDQQRTEHGVLAAASAALRPSFANADDAHVRARLQSISGTLAAWDLSAAAFEKDGTFVAGDARLSSDGLPAGQEAAPPVGRQTAIVPTATGYVLLIRDPESIVRFRVTLGFALVVSLVLAASIAFTFGLHWARQRARVIDRARDEFRSIASGSDRTPAAIGEDGAFGDAFAAAGDAVDRLLTAVREGAEVEGRLRTFLADAGHELRTPLAIAVGYVGILKRSAVSDPALAERIANDISVEHERLTRLVELILHLARLDAVPAEAGAISDVGRIAQEAVALVRPLDVERSISCDDRAGTLAEIGADDLRDALRNLLENAIRYAPASPITISIANDGDDVVTWVKDAGPGMDGFTAAHAFDRFFRGQNRGDVTGVGLGLAIVRRIVERAGGRVRLETALGDGTAVEVRLPRADRASPATDPSA